MNFDEVPAGTVVCKQNDICDGFYIVLSGKLDILISSIAGLDLGQPLVKKTLKLYDFFGADWLDQYKGIAQGTVLAKTHSILLRTPAERFAELCTICPLLQVRLEKMHGEQQEVEQRELAVIRAVVSSVRKEYEKKFVDLEKMLNTKN